MEALAETLDVKLIIKGPQPDLLHTSWLLSQTRFTMSNSKATMSLLVSSISQMAAATLLGSVQITAGTLWATSAYVWLGIVVAGSMSFSLLSTWMWALSASSLVLKERTTFPLGSLEVLCSADGMLMPPFSGSLKKVERMRLQHFVSSVGEWWRIGASLLAFFIEMKISFSCASGEMVGLGGVRRFCDKGALAAAT